MKIAIANDHSAVEMKNEIKHMWSQRDMRSLTSDKTLLRAVIIRHTERKLDVAVASGEAKYGIAICGTGIGIGIAAGKVNGVRVCTCSEPYSARMSRKHNDTNVLTFGARVIGVEMAKMIVDEWLDNEYEGGRHQRRVDMLMEIEKNA